MKPQRSSPPSLSSSPEPLGEGFSLLACPSEITTWKSKKKDMRAPPREGWKEMGGGSQSCGSYSGSQRRKGGPLCDCGFEAPAVTSWTGENPGRKFYGCGLFKIHGKRVCRFFVWYDEYHGLGKYDKSDEENAREKKIIGSLLRKIDAMKKKERLLEISLGTCIVLIMALIILLVFAVVFK
ncbi:uncharacterized protein LOC130719715 [Lotus japonicus]|uniref:uncharacterized protein LOC130719715 n=1 Tax=Lotus japonicus TaxID=34305 RepID=UPI00258AF0D5|nr:uncharacterized protein LOC130719715 [Lotus japonicus]